MKKTFLLYLIIIFQTSFSQITVDYFTVENVNSKPQFNTPEVGSLLQNVNIPVNLNTGTPNISIPLYTLKYGGMEVPITLDYDATGVKVEDIASSVGLKWNLNVGGALNRIKQGAEDESSNLPITSILGPGIPDFSMLQDASGYYRGHGLQVLNEIHNMSDPLLKNHQTLGLLQTSAKGETDTQPDLFQVNALGKHNLQFMFNENREAVIFNKNTDYKINVDFIGSEFQNWEVNSPDGMKMIFGSDNDGIVETEESYLNNANSSWMDSPGYWSRRSWFLSEITNQNTNKTIFFNYQPTSYNDLFYLNHEYRNIYNSVTHDMNDGLPPSILLPITMINSQAPNHFMDLYSIVTASQAVPADVTPIAGVPTGMVPVASLKMRLKMIKSNILSSINAGDIQIDFELSNRDDLVSSTHSFATPKKIDKITIRYKGNCIKEFNFNYSYFVAQQNTFNPQFSMSHDFYEVSHKRLKLESLEELSCNNNDKKTYHFSYYEDNNLPLRASFAKDMWGFYNGALENLSLYPKLSEQYLNDHPLWADRSVNFNYAITGTLKEITYPTQGKTEFIYESHQDDDRVLPNFDLEVSYLSTEGGINGHLNSSNSSINNYSIGQCSDCYVAVAQDQIQVPTGETKRISLSLYNKLRGCSFSYSQPSQCYKAGNSISNNFYDSKYLASNINSKSVEIYKNINGQLNLIKSFNYQILSNVTEDDVLSNINEPFSYSSNPEDPINDNGDEMPQDPDYDYNYDLSEGVYIIKRYYYLVNDPTYDNPNYSGAYNNARAVLHSEYTVSSIQAPPQLPKIF